MDLLLVVVTLLQGLYNDWLMKDCLTGQFNPECISIYSILVGYTY